MARVRIDDDVNQPSARVMVVVPGLKVQVVQPGTTTAVTVYQAETGGATHAWFGTDTRGVVVPFTADPATTGVAVAGGEMWVETGQTVELRVLSVPAGTELGRKRYPLISPSVETVIDTGTGGLGGIRIDDPTVASGFTYRVVNKDGIIFIDNLADASGSGSSDFMNVIGGYGTKTGTGTINWFWASIQHKSSGEAGLFIGDITATADGSGGNLWGIDTVLIDNKGAQMYGARLSFAPNVARSGKTGNGIILENQNSVSVTGTTTSASNQLTSVSATTLVNGMVLTGTGIPTGTTVSSGGGTSTITMSANATASATVTVVGQQKLDQAVRVLGKWDRPFIAYSDAAGTTAIWDVDSTGKMRSGHAFPMGNSLYDFGDISNRWRTIFVNNVAVNGADGAGGGGNVAIKNTAAAPSSTPSQGGVLYSEAGALKWKGSSGTVTVVAPA